MRRLTEKLEIFLRICELPFSVGENFVNSVANTAITQLLFFSQFNIAKAVFSENPIWKDKLKPTYFAVLKLLNEKNEVLKMTPDLNYQVDDIISVVKESSERLKRSRI